MISISDNQLHAIIGRFPISPMYILGNTNTTNVDLDKADIDTVSGIAGVINDYGITVVLSAVLIIFAVVMFNLIVKRSVNSEQVLMKKTQEIVTRLDNVETILDHESRSSEVFDRLNVKVTHEFDEIGRKLSDIKYDLEKILEKLEQ